MFSWRRWLTWLTFNPKFDGSIPLGTKVLQRFCLLFSFETNKPAVRINVKRKNADVVRELEGEAYVTLSRVIPALTEIRLALLDPEMQLKIAPFELLADRLKDALKEKFAFIFDDRSANFDPTYALASLLDPKFCLSLNHADLRRLRVAALKEAKLLLRNLEPTVEAAGADQPVPTVREPPAKYVRLFSQIDATSVAPSVDEADIYFRRCAEFAAAEVEAVDFWAKKSEEYPKLSRIALAVLSIPATTAPVERTFSRCGLCSSNLNAAITDENLAREAKIKVNRLYFAR